MSINTDIFELQCLRKNVKLSHFHAEIETSCLMIRVKNHILDTMYEC